MSNDIGTPIKPFRFWCQHVIPLVYDDSLSYYETLCKIKDTLNQLVEGFNNIPELIAEEIKKQIGDIQEQITQLKIYIDAQDKYVLASANNYTDEEIVKVNNTITENYTEIIEHISTISSIIQRQINSINISLINLKNYTDTQINMANNRTDKLIADLQEQINNLQFNLPDIYNPVVGEKTSIQQAILDLYDGLRYEAFNCYEFDNSGITCIEFDDSNITAKDFDLKGRVILKRIISKICDCEIIDPFTGMLNTVQNVVNEVISFFNTNSLTANEFDGKQLTAENFDDKNISAYNFDFNGKTILV